MNQSLEKKLSDRKITIRKHRSLFKYIFPFFPDNLFGYAQLCLINMIKSDLIHRLC